MSSLSIRSFTLFREEQPVRDALVLFTLTLLLHFLGAMLRLVQELSFFWPLNAVMAGIFARYVWLNRSYFYAVCFAAMLVFDGLTSRWGMGFASLLINFSNAAFSWRYAASGAGALFLLAAQCSDGRDFCTLCMA